MRFFSPAAVPSRLAQGHFEDLVTNHEERLGVWTDYLGQARVRDRLGLGVATVGVVGGLTTNLVTHGGLLSMLFHTPALHQPGGMVHLATTGVTMAGFLYQVLSGIVAARVQTRAREESNALHALIHANPTAHEALLVRRDDVQAVDQPGVLASAPRRRMT